ncbi:GNAT family protein [uncultured Microbacterium sp.]|uniref:GNAT family N-acetyltransferase n=1 Tax=uncultured Microbacterium sp. TaxID=191216 RepID=UPI0025E36192|nr:GNAT family protein [uncultured Microbacterium sp.]
MSTPQTPVADLASIWPPAGLRVSAGDLELRWPSDADLVALAGLAAEGVHDADRMPFTIPWTRGTPDEIARSVLSYQWSVRGEVGSKKLRLELAVVRGGEIVGMQGAGGSDWAVLREAETGSWLGRRFHGQGIGTRMRVLMLHLLFEGLGAEHVTSAAMLDNPASTRVSEKTGYELDGLQRFVRDGEPVTARRFRLTRERWEQVRAANERMLGAPLHLEGVDAVRALLEPQP